MKWLCRGKVIKKDKYRWEGGYAVLKQGQSRRKRIGLEKSHRVKEWIFAVVFGEVCISYLVPFQSPEMREIQELFKLTEN